MKDATSKELCGIAVAWFTLRASQGDFICSQVAVVINACEHWESLYSYSFF